MDPDLDAELDAPSLPPGTVLVRLHASSGAWIHRLPEVPGGRTVTVSVSDAEVGRVPADELVSRGYRIVGQTGPGRGPLAGERGVVLLVPGGLRTAHPRWWRTLGGASDGIFDCAFGPVRRAFAATLAMHARARAAYRP